MQGGGTEPPKKPDLENFAKKVMEFFKRRPEETCAVHCTHGINRSGFFIVTFLIGRNSQPSLDMVPLQYKSTETLTFQNASQSTAACRVRTRLQHSPPRAPRAFGIMPILTSSMLGMAAAPSQGQR